MKKKLNIALIGFGKFGIKYANNLLKSNLFNLKIIIRKKKIKNFYKKIPISSNISEIKKNNVDCAIIATSPETHYKIIKKIINYNLPFIIEKPVVNNFKNLNKIYKLSCAKKNLIFVNHSDYYNSFFQKIEKHKKKIGKFLFIYGEFIKPSNQYKSSNFIPLENWLSHILFILQQFCSVDKFVVTKNILKFFQNKYYQFTIIDFFKNKNLLARIKFSNFNLKKKRLLKIYGEKGIISYNSYNIDKNFVSLKRKYFFRSNHGTPMNNLLKKFYKHIKLKKKTNQLTVVMRYQKLFDKIIKKTKMLN